MTDSSVENGPVSKDFKSAQALSLMLGLASVVVWVLLAWMVRLDSGGGPGAVVTLWIAVVLTVFSAAAYAVAWVVVVVHKGTVAVQQSLTDANRG